MVKNVQQHHKFIVKIGTNDFVKEIQNIKKNNNINDPLFYNNFDCNILNFSFFIDDITGGQFHPETIGLFFYIYYINFINFYL